MSEPTRQPPITSAQRIAAFFLLDQAVSTGEQRLFAVIDGASCLLSRGHRESARLLVEIVAPELAGRTVRILLGEEGETI